MNPAANIIKLFGGPTEVARITGVHRTRVHAWKTAKEKGGSGGRVPIKHIDRLLSVAKERNIDLRPEHFFPTRCEPEA